MTSTSEIDRAIANTQSQISRLEAIERQGAASKPLLKRMAGHLTKNGNFLAPMLMAGCVFSVAWTQLQQKYAYQRDVTSRDDQLETLRAERQGLLDSLGVLETRHQDLQDHVILELDRGGLRLAPTAKRIRELIASEAQSLPTDKMDVKAVSAKSGVNKAPADTKSRLMI